MHTALIILIVYAIGFLVTMMVLPLVIDPRQRTLAGDLLVALQWPFFWIVTLIIIAPLLIRLWMTRP